MFTDLAFVAAVAFVIPRLAGLSWSELLSAAPDVAWWLIIAATLSLITAGARMRRRWLTDLELSIIPNPNRASDS